MSLYACHINYVKVKCSASKIDSYSQCWRSWAQIGKREGCRPPLPAQHSLKSFAMCHSDRFVDCDPELSCDYPGSQYVRRDSATLIPECRTSEIGHSPSTL